MGNRRPRSRRSKRLSTILNSTIGDAQLSSEQKEGHPELLVPGMPIKFSESEDPEIYSSARVGEDTAEVLSEVADYSNERIAKLDEDGAL